MRFLLTGAYGFVGTNLCRYLAGRGHACDALDVPAAVRSDVPYGRIFVWDDLARVDLTAYDAIVHLAGKAHDLRKVASEQSYFDVNLGLTQEIFGALKAQTEAKSPASGRRKVAFIHFSTCKSVERDTPYAKSKWAAEQWLRSNGSDSLTVTILRPAPIHGPGNRGNLNLLWSVVRHGLPWPLAAFENKRPFTSVGNVCAAVEALAERPADETFFICDDDFVSTNRIIELMAKVRGKRARMWRLPKGLMTFAAGVGDILHLPLDTERLEKLTENYSVDNSRLKAHLGWTRFPVFVEDGMLETFASFLK